jgi:UDP-2,4-diacetamido-2,4,6-trideoxy-beta-L-altropyranose hydrolase
MEGERAVSSSTITIAAAARPGDGLGHLSRSSSLAVALRARGAAVRCIGLGAEAASTRDGVEWIPADRVEDTTGVIVFDSYVDEPPSAERLALFHDEGDVPAGVELVVSSDPRLAGSDGVLAGPAYACLRPVFWGLPPRRPAPAAARTVLVCTGGGDPGGVAVPLANAVASALPDARVRLVRGPLADWSAPDGVEVIERPSDLLGAFEDADIAVITAGQLLYEALAVGTPTVALPVVSNQRVAAEFVSEEGAAVVVDSVDAAAQAAAELSNDSAGADALSRAAQQLVDGYGALRVAFRVRAIAEVAGP